MPPRILIRSSSVCPGIDMTCSTGAVFHKADQRSSQTKRQSRLVPVPSSWYLLSLPSRHLQTAVSPRKWGSSISISSGILQSPVARRRIIGARVSIAASIFRSAIGTDSLPVTRSMSKPIPRIAWLKSLIAPTASGRYLRR